MTESFANDPTWEPEHLSLYPGEVQVFYADQKSFIVLDEATSSIHSVPSPEGRHHFEQLRLADGITLTPAELYPDKKITDFAKAFQPVVQFGGKALLRTAQFSEEMKFLEMTRPLVIKDDMGSMSDLQAIQIQILNAEQKRMPEAQLQVRELRRDRTNPELWIRLEATYNPDISLAGKVIMAQLAGFAFDEYDVAIAPLINSVENRKPVPIPEHLTINENWLYAEFKVDDDPR